MRINPLPRIRQAYNVTLPKMPDKQYRQTVYAKAGLYAVSAAGLAWLWQGVMLLFEKPKQYIVFTHPLQSKHKHKKDDK